MSEQDSPASWEADSPSVDAEVEALQAEVQALKEQVLRYAAEAENTKRRAEREMNDARAYAIQKFGRDLLGAADNLDRAMAAAPADSGDPAVKNYVIGVEMTTRELLGAFEDYKRRTLPTFTSPLLDATLANRLQNASKTPPSS